ncbi:MAG: hypothetical protein O2971_13230 [Proteobacteria bacterium]|nr:hypothetical protein [Pseudomonadota bacterium]
MSNAELLVGQLSHCKETSPRKWIARCPSHDDHSPSLSVRELADGHVLVKCHAGCETQEVLESVGLSMRNLFPDNQRAIDRRKIWAKKHELIKELLSEEKMYVLIFNAHVAAGKSATELEVKRVALARVRIQKIERILGDE